MPNKSVWDGIGHLGRDAEVKQIGSSQAVEFSIAVTNKKAQSTSWFRCTWFGKNAVDLAQYMTKGRAISVVGELIPREYKNKQDELRTSLDVRVYGVTLLDGGGSGGGDSLPPSSVGPKSAADTNESEDIPF